jgi:hypothetical protein
MANGNNPHGLRPLMRSLYGGNVQIEEYNVPATTAAIFIHDAVIALTGGSVITGAITPMVAAGTGTPVGVSLDYFASNAAAALSHRVIHSPDSVFEAQDDGVGGGIVLANLGKNANLAFTTAGSTSSRISGMQIGTASVNTTNTLDVMLHRLLNIPNNAFGANAIIEITFNRHFYGLGRTGV